jgi:hypothetical protein
MYNVRIQLEQRPGSRLRCLQDTYVVRSKGAMIYSGLNMSLRETVSMAIVTSMALSSSSILNFA